MSDYIFIDGYRVKTPLPARSLFYGEGLFETFRYKNELPTLIDKHLERMGAGAELLEVPLPSNQHIKDLIEKAVQESRLKDAYVKICLISDEDSVFHKVANTSQVLVNIRQYQPSNKFLTLKVSSFKRISESPLLKIKSTNYLENILARREALRSGFDESLFLNERGEVAECSASNIFWLSGETLFTPSQECGLLSGTTRDLVLSSVGEPGLNPVQGQFSLSDLISADCVFVTNSLIGCVPVSKVDGVSFDTGKDFYNKIETRLFQKLKWV